jgi:replicative DNA helicase
MTATVTAFPDVEPPPDVEPANVDLELERNVLGCILVWPETLTTFDAAGLSVTDFYRHAHALVYSTAAGLASDGTPPALPLVGAALRQAGRLDEVGPAYLGRMVDGVSRASEPYARAMVDRLQSLADARRAAGVARAFAVRMDGRDGLDADAVAETLSALDSLRESRHHDAPMDTDAQLSALTAERVREKTQALYLGLPSIDNVLQGLRPGEVCGLMARPGIGKTLLLCHVTRSIAERGYGHVLVSLEMPAAQIVERLARMTLGLGYHDIRTDLDAGRLDVARYSAHYRETRIIETPSLSVAAIASQVRIVKRRQDVALVSVDHLGLIGGDRRMSTYDRVSTQARELKELAKREKIAVIVLVQVNREIGGDGSRMLTLGAARDSGVVEEALDYLVAMRRFDRCSTLNEEQRLPFRNALFLSVLKNRHGDLGSEVAVRFDPRTLAVSEDMHLEAPRTTEQETGFSRGRR